MSVPGRSRRPSFQLTVYHLMAIDLLRTAKQFLSIIEASVTSNDLKASEADEDSHSKFGEHVGGLLQLLMLRPSSCRLVDLGSIA